MANISSIPDLYDINLNSTTLSSGYSQTNDIECAIGWPGFTDFELGGNYLKTEKVSYFSNFGDGITDPNEEVYVWDSEYAIIPLRADYFDGDQENGKVIEFTSGSASGLRAMIEMNDDNGDFYVAFIFFINSIDPPMPEQGSTFTIWDNPEDIKAYYALNDLYEVTDYPHNDPSNWKNMRNFDSPVSQGEWIYDYGNAGLFTGDIYYCKADGAATFDNTDTTHFRSMWNASQGMALCIGDNSLISGSSYRRFEGEYNGNNFYLKNFYTRPVYHNSASYYGALFGHANGSISNVNISNLKINNSLRQHTDGTWINTSGLAGISRGTIDNCHVEGTMISNAVIQGGIAGQLHDTSDPTEVHIQNCSSNITIVHDDYPGGTNGLIGGIVGQVHGDSGARAWVRNCHSICDITAKCAFVGGVVGQCQGNIENCYAEGYVQGESRTGGLSGLITRICRNSYSDCEVYAPSDYLTGDQGIGGFAGYIVNLSGSNPIVTNCYSKGSVTVSGNKDFVGGFAGKCRMGGEVYDCYSACSVTQDYGNTNVRAFTGGISEEGVSLPDIHDCYFDIDLSVVDDDYATAKSTSDMKLIGTYVDWDFVDDWGILSAENDGYPYLLVFGTDDGGEEGEDGSNGEEEIDGIGVSAEYVLANYNVSSIVIGSNKILLAFIN